ncbi:unnamed protein product [Discula destructiva]
MAFQPSAGEDLISSLVGKVDNLDDPIPALNKKPMVYLLILFFLILALASGILRLYVRFRVTKCPGWDDFFIGLSLLTGTALAIGILVSFSFHMGEHLVLFASDEKQIELFALASYFPNALYPTSAALIKLAILLQFLRVFETKSRPRTAIKTMITITALWGLAFSFISWFPAFPPSAFWKTNDRTAIRYGVASLDINSFTGTLITLNATNMVLDVIVALLAVPIPYCQKSRNVSWKSRISLIGLLILGIVINGISLGRLALVIESRAGTYPAFDPSFYGCSQIVLTSLEVSLAVVAASLPVFWPVMKFGWGNILVTTVITVRQEPCGSNMAHNTNGNANPWDAKAEGWHANSTTMTILGKNKNHMEDEEALIYMEMPESKTWEEHGEEYKNGVERRSQPPHSRYATAVR